MGFIYSENRSAGSRVEERGHTGFMEICVVWRLSFWKEKISKIQNLICPWCSCALVCLFLALKYLNHPTGFHKSRYDHYNVPRGQPDVFKLYYPILSANTAENTPNCEVWPIPTWKLILIGGSWRGNKFPLRCNIHRMTSRKIRQYIKTSSKIRQYITTSSKIRHYTYLFKFYIRDNNETFEGQK